MLGRVVCRHCSFASHRYLDEMRAADARSAVVLLAGLFACADAAPPRRDGGAREAGSDDASKRISATAVRARGPLVDWNAWELVSAAEDPFDDRPPDPSCPSGSYLPEVLSGQDVFSVDTGACSYITVRQPALRDVARGESLVARVWHFALNAGDPATGHVSLRLAESTLLDETVPIPSPGGLLAIDQVADSPFAEGTPVYFHLHNHGDNSWSLVELSAGPAKP
jgi:hypothetical protein